MENTETPVNSFAFQFRRITRVSYTSASSIKATLDMIVFAESEDKALEKAKSVSKDLTESNEFYSFELHSIVER